eukprot:4884169-Pyramimonas_sp.AAC.2
MAQLLRVRARFFQTDPSKLPRSFCRDNLRACAWAAKSLRAKSYCEGPAAGAADPEDDEDENERG